MHRYRVAQDEDTGAWGIDTVEYYKESNSDTVTCYRDLKIDKEGFLFKTLFFEDYEEAECFLEECMLDTRYDITYMEREEINRHLYNYIINNGLQGFVYCKPLEVWTHSIFCESKDFEYGCLAYVASEVAALRGKREIGMFYPFQTDIDNDHAHSFNEVLAVAANAKEFKPLETDKYYSKAELDMINFVREERRIENGKVE